MTYPASTGCNSTEVLRVINYLKTGDKKSFVTPIDWQVGDDVIVPPSVTMKYSKKKVRDVAGVNLNLRWTKTEVHSLVVYS